MQEQGYVTNVVVVDAGGEAVLDALIGATQITLADGYSFNELGGQFTIDDDDVAYAYTSIDMETDVMTLAAPLDVDVLMDTPLLVFPHGQEKVAMVQLDDNNEGIRAVVPFTMHDRFDDGIRDPQDMESVFVSDDKGRWEVTAVDEQIPVVSGQYIDPTTLPEPESPTAPIASPVLKAIGMPTSIMLVTSPISGTDSLTYQFSTSASGPWTTVDNMPTKQTSWVVEGIPGVGPFVVAVDYYFRVIAGNTAGDAPPSNVVSAQLDTAAIAIVAAQVVTAELISNAIAAGIVTVGSNITISADGGIEILQSDGGFTRLPSDGSSPQFTGKVVARELIVENGASIYGESDVSGSMELNATIKDPTALPTTDAYWDVRDGQLLWGQTVVESTGLCRNLANNGWVTIMNPPVGVSNYRFMEILDTGVVNVTYVPHFGQTMMGGIVTMGGEYYYMQRHGTNDWKVMQVHSLTGTTESWDNGWPVAIPGGLRSTRPALWTDGTYLTVASLDIGSISDVNITRYSVSGATITAVDTEYLASGIGTQQDLVGFYKGSADFGAVKYVVQYASLDVRIYNTTDSGIYAGTYVSGFVDGWVRPYTWTMRGLYWDGTYFRVVDPYGRIARLEPKATLSASWWAYSWVDGDTHTTLPSPRKNWTPPHRSLVTVTSATPPQATDPGTHVANRLQVYAASSAVATLYKQGGALAAGTVAWPYNPIRETVTAHPGSNNWAGVIIPGEIRSSASDAQGNIIDLNGDGSGRTGPLTWGADGKNLAEFQQGASGGTYSPSATVSAGTPAGLADLVFVAPPSGRVLIIMSMFMLSKTSGQATNAYPEVRTGDVLRSGTVVLAYTNGDGIGNYNGEYVKGSAVAFLDDLVPGDSYNAYPVVSCGAAGATWTIGKMKVAPLP